MTSANAEKSPENGPQKLPWPSLSGSAVMLAGSIIRAIRKSGAVPASEFPPAAPVYEALPGILIAGMWLLAWWGLATRPWSGDGWQRVAALSAVVAVAGLVVPAIIAPAILVHLLAGSIAAGRVAVDGAAPVDETRAARRLRAPSFIWFLLGTWALATAATFLLVLWESWTFTPRFLPHLVTVEQLGSHRLALGGYSWLLGLQDTLVVGALVLAMFATLHLLTRRGPARLPFALAVLEGVSIAAVLLMVIQSCLNTEITQLGLWPGALGLMSVIALTVARSCWRGPRLLSRSARSEADADLPHLFARTPLLVLGSRWAGTQRARGIVGLVLCSVAVVVLVAALYPTVEDFRMQLFDGFAHLAVLTVALGLWCGIQAAGIERLARWFAIPVLVAGAALLVTTTRRPDLGVVAHEYSRFGSLLEDTPAVRLGVPFPDVGAEDGARPAYPHHPAARAATNGGSTSSRPPIIIVVWDAARPDRLSAYGYERETTPHLVGLARGAAVFTRAISSATATTVAVKGLLSGCYATRFMLATEHPPFVTRYLADAGYDHFVITVTGNDYNGVSAEAFQRGWDGERAGLTWEPLVFPNRDRKKPDREKTDAVLSSLRRLKQTRPAGLDGTFTYLHLTGPHIPWTNADPVRDFGKLPGDLYDGELAKADALLGRLLDGLTDLGVRERVLLVVTSDHGTGLGEHGKLAGYLPYEEQVRIPLVIHLPGGRHAARIEDRVGSIDLVPTILDTIGAPAPGSLHGRSLLPVMNGSLPQLPPRPFVTFCAFRDSYGVYDAGTDFKLHHHRGRRYEALYDLRTDPGERTNLITSHPEIATRLRDLLDRFLWEGRASYGNPYHYRQWSGGR